MLAEESKSTPLELSLYENAIDSIRHALEHYISDPDEKRRYKYTILHLSQGVLLLLKERLKREHPNFIYTNVTDETKTVDLELAISRLQKIAKVDLSYYDSAIRELASLRNKVEHYALRLPKDQADSVIGRIVPFLIFFTQTELEKGLRYEIGDENWQALLAIREYLVHAIKDAEAKIRIENKTPYFCKKCQAHTATETSFFPEDDDKWSLHYSLIQCLVCSDFVASRMQCRHCNRELILGPHPFAYYSYCDDCRAKLRQEFPNVRSPEYVAEVRKWFIENETISIETLEKLRNNVIVAGPSSRFTYIDGLYEEGVIDFAYDYEKTQYLASKDVMPPMLSGISATNATFKWALPSRDVGSDNGHD